MKMGLHELLVLMQIACHFFLQVLKYRPCGAVLLQEAACKFIKSIVACRGS